MSEGSLMIVEQKQITSVTTSQREAVAEERVTASSKQSGLKDSAATCNIQVASHQYIMKSVKKCCTVTTKVFFSLVMSLGIITRCTAPWIPARNNSLTQHHSSNHFHLH